MKKYFLIFILSLTSKIFFGQISYKPVFIDPCVKLPQENFWYLKSKDTFYGINTMYKNSVELSKKGKYTLYYNIEDSISIDINKTGKIKDTILLERVKLKIHIAPFSEYTICDSLLINGKVLDYHYNGNIRFKGEFKNGQPISDIYKYHNNGNIKEYFSKNKKWKNITYHDNLQVKSIYDTKRKYNLEFYRNGQLKHKHQWFSKNKANKSFYANGNIKTIYNNKDYKLYNSEKKIIDIITRKNKTRFKKFIPFNFKNHYSTYYEFEWKKIEGKNLKFKIKFRDIEFSSQSGFPLKINDIKDYSLLEVVFFDQERETRKINFAYKKINNKFKKTLKIFNKKDGVWKEESYNNMMNISDLIKKYSK